ncbi:hypothetical protein OG21DRAFT_1502206 [Imleria badia]|nr:hypothetical protein OG21DRAFT_1502206 [Imleria badia]
MPTHPTELNRPLKPSTSSPEVHTSPRTGSVYPAVVRADLINFCQTMPLDSFAGLIYTAILIVDFLFFFLKQWMPRHEMDSSRTIGPPLRETQHSDIVTD